MGDNFTECSTGILIDFGDNEEEKNISLYIEKQENSSASCVSYSQEKSTNKYLGAELNSRREMFVTPKRRWRTPSPKSMKMISKEATRIIDQLYASPIETMEPQLIDEDFPTPFSLDSCSSESSPESDNICKRCAPSGTDQSTILKDSCDTTYGCCNNELPNLNHTKSPNFEDDKVFNEVNVTEDKSQIESTNSEDRKLLNEENVIEAAENKIEHTNSEDRKLLNELNVIEAKHTIDSNFEDSEVLKEVTKHKNQIKSPNSEDNKVSNDVKETEAVNEIESPNSNDSKVFNGMKVAKDNDSKSSIVPSDLEQKSPLKNTNKVSVKSTKYLGKENLGLKNSTATGMRFLPSKISVNKGRGDRNLILNAEKKLSLKEVSEKGCKAVISKKVVAQNTTEHNKSNSDVPKLARTMPCLPSFSQKQSSKTESSSKVLTPVSKVVRRTNSFQSNNGKFSLKSSEIGFDTSFSSKNIQNRVGSTKKDSNNGLGKTRLSFSQIPGSNPKYTPVSRSKSFPKSSSTLSSNAPRPNLSFSARKTESTSEDNQHLNHNRSVISTSSRIRFTSRLCLPSPLPDAMNINLPRKLFPDVKTIKKR